MPSSGEWKTLRTALGSLSYNTGLVNNLLLPKAGMRSYQNSSIYNQGSAGNYWSSSRGNNGVIYRTYFATTYGSESTDSSADGFSVRCFKNSPQPVEITYDPNG